MNESQHLDAYVEKTLKDLKESNIANFRRHLRRLGTLTLLNAGAVALLLKGMPGHYLWPILGKPLLICCGLLFVVSVYLAATLIAIHLDN